MFTFGYKTKFGSIVRALAAIGIGIVLIWGTDAPLTVVKIIACFLMAAGVVSLIYGIVKNKQQGTLHLMAVNAIVDVVIGLLLFFRPELVSNFIVYLIGIALILFGALQLIALSSAMSLLGAGFASLLLSIFAVVGGAFLLFSPFGLQVMSVIAGCLMLVYGVSELISTWRMSKAKTEYEIKFAPKPQPSPSQEGDKVDTSSIGEAKEVDYKKVDDQ